MAVQVQIRLSAEDDDFDRLEEAGIRLRTELRQLDVIDVAPVAGGQAPPGARGVPSALVASVLVTINQTPVLLRRLVDVVRNWLARDRGGRTAELVIAGDSLVVTGLAGPEQERLIEAWLVAHSLDQIPQG